jgi:hypothetical protein
MKKQRNTKKDYRLALKNLRKLDKKNYQFLKSKKLPGEVVNALSYLDVEFRRLKLGLETLRKVMMDKKLATKKEIDKTIDKVLIKKYGKLR